MAATRGRRCELTRRARFESLYKEHYGHVLAYGLRRTNPHEAEDLVAETFLTAWRRFHEIPADPLPWLYGVARHILRNHRRGNRRRDNLANHLQHERWTPVAIAPDPAERLAWQDELLAAVARLSPLDREVLSLVVWEELSPDRAAVAMSCSRGTFAVRLHRARQRLAAMLEDIRDAAETSEGVR